AAGPATRALLPDDVGCILQPLQSATLPTWRRGRRIPRRSASFRVAAARLHQHRAVLPRPVGDPAARLPAAKRTDGRAGIPRERRRGRGYPHILDRRRLASVADPAETSARSAHTAV